MKATRQMARSAELARQVQNPRILSAIAAANRSFGVVLGVANSADRTPPAQAYTIYREALRALDAIKIN
jgi:hypothetical protein